MQLAALFPRKFDPILHHLSVSQSQNSFPDDSGLVPRYAGAYASSPLSSRLPSFIQLGTPARTSPVVSLAQLQHFYYSGSSMEYVDMLRHLSLPSTTYQQLIFTTSSDEENESETDQTYETTSSILRNWVSDNTQSCSYQVKISMTTHGHSSYDLQAIYIHYSPSTYALRVPCLRRWEIDI